MLCFFKAHTARFHTSCALNVPDFNIFTQYPHKTKGGKAPAPLFCKSAAVTKITEIHGGQDLPPTWTCVFRILW